MRRKTNAQDTYTAFDGSRLLAQGHLGDVVLQVKRKIGRADNSNILIFSDSTGKAMDFNFQGSEKDVLKRLETFISVVSNLPTESLGPGRPKLGVVSREVSLLPRHWEWLATQTSGTSATLRNLVEEAKKKSSGLSEAKQAQERTYRVMSSLAGDFKNYEEALRALYKKDHKKFLILIEDWPADIHDHIIELSRSVF